jgi:V8-like Glu-specific endopeptidase
MTTVARRCTTFVHLAQAVGLCFLSASIAHADGKSIDPAALKKVKDSTVYLQVTLPDGSVVQGTGFVIGSPLILTNAHVLGMLDADSRPPQKISVVFRSGETDSRTVPGIVRGVDRESDLGVVRVDPKDLPPALQLASTNALTETEDVFIFGFPLGKQLGNNITVSRSSVSSLRKTNGVLNQIQVNGGMHPGNSGGPVTDASGKVLGVAVSGYKGTQIQFAIPSGKIPYFLNGRMNLITVLTPPRKEGNEIKLGLHLDMIDPLNKIKKVDVEYWIGSAGPKRPASSTEPVALPGDSPKQTLSLAYDQKKGTADGIAALPPLTEPKTVYWFRPLIVYEKSKNWRQSYTFNLGPPVEPVATTLSYKPALGKQAVLDLNSTSTLRVRDNEGKEHKLALSLRTSLGEDIHRDAAKKRFPVTLAYDKLKMTILLDDKPMAADKQLSQIEVGVNRFLSAQVTMDAQGNQVDTKSQINNAPRALREPLVDINTQVMQSLGVLSVPLPAGKIEPDKTWQAQRMLMVGSLGMYVPAVADMEYKYLGTRVRDGKTEAVIRLSGTVRGRAGKGLNLGGTVKGTTVLAADTGEIVDSRANFKVDMDLKVEDETVKAGGNLDVVLKRLEAKPGEPAKAKK